MDDDRETRRPEHIFGQLKLTMADERTRTKIFNRLCGVPIAANQVEMLMALVDQALNPKSQKPEPQTVQKLLAVHKAIDAALDAMSKDNDADPL